MNYKVTNVNNNLITTISVNYLSMIIRTLCDPFDKTRLKFMIEESANVSGRFIRENSRNAPS